MAPPTASASPIVTPTSVYPTSTYHPYPPPQATPVAAAAAPVQVYDANTKTSYYAQPPVSPIKSAYYLGIYWITLCLCALSIHYIGLIISMYILMIYPVAVEATLMWVCKLLIYSKASSCTVSVAKAWSIISWVSILMICKSAIAHQLPLPLYLSYPASIYSVVPIT